MTIHIDDYTVEIYAKEGSNGYNKDALAGFLNTLACLAWDAKDYNKENNWNTLAGEARRYAYAFGDARRELEGEA